MRLKLGSVTRAYDFIPITQPLANAGLFQLAPTIRRTLRGVLSYKPVIGDYIQARLYRPPGPGLERIRTPNDQADAPEKVQEETI